MGLNNSAKEKKLERRKLVAELRLRGLTMREIAASIVNPDTGKPYTATTINNDLKVLQQEWKTAAMVDISEHKGRQFAEIQQAKIKAWANGDMVMLHKWINTEIKLLGTAEPVEINLNTIFADMGLDKEDIIDGYADHLEATLIAPPSETSYSQ